MGQDVTKASSGGGALRAPAPMSIDLTKRLAVHRNGLRRDEAGKVAIDPDYLPSTELRDELRQRLRQLGDALDRRDKAAGDGKSVIRAVVATMFEATTTSKMSDDAAVVKVGAYRTFLRDLPLFAVVEACGRFARGMVPSHKKGFPPTSAEIAEEARRIYEPWSAERAHILELLQAKALPPPPNPGERQRLAKGFDQLVAEIAGNKKAAEVAEAARPAPPDPFAAYRVKRGGEDDENHET